MHVIVWESESCHIHTHYVGCSSHRSWQYTWQFSENAPVIKNVKLTFHKSVSASQSPQLWLSGPGLLTQTVLFCELASVSMLLFGCLVDVKESRRGWRAEAHSYWSHFVALTIWNANDRGQTLITITHRKWQRHLHIISTGLLQILGTDTPSNP